MPVKKNISTNASSATKKTTRNRKSETTTSARSKNTILRKTSSKIKGLVNDDERTRMINESAYFRAQRCGFKSDPTRDWLEAESEIDTYIADLKKPKVTRRTARTT